MRIGIVTDIHDEVEHLAAALRTLQDERADAVVCLGDSTDFHGPYNRAWEVARLLRDHGAIGVWGNHDCGLCRDVPLEALSTPPDHEALAYFASWQPWAALGGCHFSHVEPWLDLTDPAALWYYDDPPVTPAEYARTFAVVPHPACFIGHFHKWMAGTSAGRLPWKGDTQLSLDPADRHLVVVGPLFAGAFALLDTDARTLTPHRLP